MQHSLRALADDMRLAAAFLTRIPLPHPEDPARSNLPRCFRMFPLVGALIGLATGLLYAALCAIHIPPLAAAAVAFGASAFATGALHEDGMADVADGLGGYTRERRLEIMRDSRVGTFGALALVFGAIAKVSALVALPTPLAIAALTASGAIARALPAALSRWTPYARSDGLASTAGRPELGAIVTGFVLAALIAAVALPPLWALAAAPVALVAALAVRWLAMRQLGGHTGDVLGCAEQMCEIALLLLFAALAAQQAAVMATGMAT